LYSVEVDKMFLRLVFAEVGLGETNLRMVNKHIRLMTDKNQPQF